MEVAAEAPCSADELAALEETGRPVLGVLCGVAAAASFSVLKGHEKIKQNKKTAIANSAELEIVIRDGSQSEARRLRVRSMSLDSRHQQQQLW